MKRAAANDDDVVFFLCLHLHDAFGEKREQLLHRPADQAPSG